MTMPDLRVERQPAGNLTIAPSLGLRVRLVIAGHRCPLCAIVSTVFATPGILSSARRLDPAGGASRGRFPDR